MYNVVAVVIEVAIIHLNTRSLMRSFDKLNSFLRNLNMPFSVIGMTETWLTDWGISSSGRAPALHAGGTGIDTRILHFFPILFILLKK